MAEMQQSNNVKYPNVLSGPPDHSEVWAGHQEKVLPQRAVGMEQTAQSNGHGPELLEFRERLDSALRHRV